MSDVLIPTQIWDPEVSAWLELKRVHRDERWQVVPYRRCSDHDQIIYGRRSAEAEKRKRPQSEYKSYKRWKKRWKPGSPPGEYTVNWDEASSVSEEQWNRAKGIPYARYVEYGGRGFGKTARGFGKTARVNRAWEEALRESEKMAREWEEAMKRTHDMMNISSDQIEQLKKDIMGLPEKGEEDGNS